MTNTNDRAGQVSIPNLNADAVSCLIDNLIDCACVARQRATRLLAAPSCRPQAIPYRARQPAKTWSRPTACCPLHGDCSCLQAPLCLLAPCLVSVCRYRTCTIAAPCLFLMLSDHVCPSDRISSTHCRNSHWIAYRTGIVSACTPHRPCPLPFILTSSED